MGRGAARRKAHTCCFGSLQNDRWINAAFCIWFCNRLVLLFAPEHFILPSGISQDGLVPPRVAVYRRRRDALPRRLQVGQSRVLERREAHVAGADELAAHAPDTASDLRDADHPGLGETHERPSGSEGR